MKYLIAAAAGLVMFVLSFIVIGLAASLAIPPGFNKFLFKVGPLGFNIVSLVSLVGASLIAVQIFRTSLKAKTGRLYRKEKVQEPKPDRYRFQ